jgi:outer membrane protein assembly factor BamA
MRRRKTHPPVFGKFPLQCVSLFGLLLALGGQLFAAKIASIHVVGNRRYSEAQIVAASGLQPGQAFDAGALQAATQRLGATGAFDDVEYKYAPAGADTAIEFTVVEAPKLHRYVFDNFVWFSNQEIEAYLGKRVPLFGDALPESGTVIDDVTAALQELLAANKVEAQAGHTQYGGLGSANWQHVFTASGPEIKIKSVQFQGVQGMDGAVLAQEATPLVGRSYSGLQCDTFGTDTFVPVYRERGYLRVELGKAVARVVGPAPGISQYDVEVTFPVEEGLVYNWNSVQWTGNQILATTELDGLMGMSQGALANGKKIDAGWEQVDQAYGKHGYVEAHVKPAPTYDDASRSVSFRAAVSEGPQYHMGTFTVSGPPLAVVQQIQSRWRLKPGAIYDSTYWHDFATKDLPSLLAAVQLHMTSILLEPRLNRDQLTVDVSLVLR